LFDHLCIVRDHMWSIQPVSVRGVR
jgi:hypothetical protein